MKTKLYASLAVSALALAFSGYASAAVLDCDPGTRSDATAKGADEDERIADFCAYSTETTSPESEKDFVNDEQPQGWDFFDENFIYIGKWEDGKHKEADLGFTFTVTEGSYSVEIDDEIYDYNFSYRLQAGSDTEWSGATIDWVLGIKDGAGSAGGGGFVAYYWQSLTLDIDGGFSSFFSGSDVFSHASAFVRLHDENGFENGQIIPEPATLGLLGIGLFGLGMASYRRRRLASTEV